MINYHLVPDGARWKLTCEDDGSIRYFDTKEHALKGCAEYMIEQYGSLKIHHADGTFEEERNLSTIRRSSEIAGLIAGHIRSY